MEALLRALRGEGFFAWAGVLLVRGPDALPFLQGQCTRDLRRLNGPLGALFLNHKGHIEEAATLFPHPEGFLLAPWGGLEDLKRRLERYIVFDQVELKPLPLYRVLYPDGREELKEEAPGAWPEEVYQAYALLKAWPLPEVFRGELPQAVGLEGLVDRGKGCYVGQEIMARTEGKALPYRLMGLRALEPPKAAFVEIFQGDKTLGRVKLLLETPFGLLGLALLRREVEAGALVEGGGGRFGVEALPFSLGPRGTR